MATPSKGIENLYNSLKEQGLQADITVDDMQYMLETNEQFAKAVHQSMAKNYNNIGDADSFYSKLGITYAKPKAVEETATINAEIQPTEAETPVVATPKVETPVTEIQPTAPVAEPKEPKTPAQIMAQTKEKTTSNNANSAPATDESMLAKEQEIMQAQAQAVAPQAEAQPVAQPENTQSVAEEQPMAQTSSIDRQFSTEADAPYDTTQAEQPIEDPEQAEQPQVAEETTEEQAQTEQPSTRKVFLADGENIAQTEIVREDADNYYVLDDAGKEMPINKTYGSQFFDSYDQAKEFNNQFSLEAEGLAERILSTANESKSSNQAVNDIIINSSGYKQLQGNDFGEWAFGETQAYAADSDNASPMSVAVISEYIPLVAPVASTVKQLQRLAKHEDGGKVYQELYHAVKSVGETYALAKTDADYNKINQNLAKRVEGIRMTAYAEAVLDGENFAKAKEEIAKWTNADDPDKVDMPETNKALLIVDTMKRSLSWSAEHPELADYNPYKNWDRYINNPEAQNNVGYDIDNIEWALSNIEPTTLKQWLSRSGKHNESAWADASYKIFNARMGENAFGLQMNVGAYLNQEDAWMAGLLNNAGIKDVDHYIHNAWFDELYDAVKPQLLTVYKNEADAKQLVRNFVTGRQVSKVFNSEYDQDDYLNFLKEFGSNKGRYNMAMSKIDEPEEIERMFNEDQRSYDYAVSFYQAAKERNEKAKANLEQMNNGHDWLRLLGLVEPHMIAYRIGRNTLDWLKGQDETSINEKVSDIITDYEENGKQKGLFGHVTYQSAGLWNYFNQQYNESANNYWVAKVETIEDTALPMVVDFAIGTKGLALLGKGAIKVAQAAKLANYYQQLKKGSRILRTASVLYAKNPAFRVAGKAFTHMGRASLAALAMPGTYMYDNSTKAVNINPETGEAQAVDVDPMTFGEKYLEQAGAYLFFNELGAYSKGLVQGTMSASTKGLRKLLTHGSAERKALYQAGDLKTFAQEFKAAYGEAVKGIHKGGLQQTASLFGAYGAIPMVTHDLATSIIKGDEDMLKHMLTPDYYTDLAVTCLFMELGTFQLHGKAIKGIKTLAWNGSARADWSKIDATTRQRYEENLIDKSIEKQSEYISQEANRIRQIADENVRKQEAEVLSKAINYALVENARRGAEQIGVHTNMFSLSRLKAIDAIVEGTMTRYTANENAHIAELPVAKGWKKHTNEEVCVVTLADGQRAECVVVGREVRTDGQYNQNVVRIEMQAKSKKASKEAKGKGKAKDADKILSIAVDPNSVEVPYVDGRKTFVIETTEKGAELKEAEVKSIDGENVTVIVDGKVHGIKRIDLYTDAYIALESAKTLDAKIKADKAIVEMDSPKEIVAVTDADIKAEPQIATATEARVEAPEVEASHIRIEDNLAPGLVRDAHTETLAEADLVDQVAKKLGLSVRFVDAVDGGVANAKIEGNRVEIERNNPNPIKFLLGHELLHKIRTTSPDAYDAFIASARKAIPEFDKRVQMTRTAYQKADMKISNENAREEVFADFAGEMARDGKLLEKFIGESSPTLWQVLRDYYRKVKDLFTGKEFSDYERAEQALSNALKMVEQKAMKTPTEMIEVANDIPADASAETQFSIKIAHTLNEKSMEYAKQKEVSEEFMDTLRKAEADINQMAEQISQDLGGDLDAKRRGKRMLPEEVNVQDGKPLKGYSTIFKNGSYGRTMENTLKCLRTLAYIDFVNDVKERIGRPLTSQESFLASQMLYDISVDPQCLYCYVSLDRKAYDEFLIRYLNQRDAVITAYDSLSAKDKKNPKVIDELYQDFLASRKDTKEMKRRFNMWIDARKAGLPLLNAADVATTTRRDNIRNNGNETLKAQLKDAEAYAQGASWAKKEDEYRAYTGEILRLPQSTVNTLNKEYGLRFYSFSEYSPAFIVENMQMIRDAAIRGLRGLAYTKEIDFVKIFAPSQININVSVFGRLDANGNMVADTRQGADWAEAKALREKYPNVGAVFVATNDAAVEWALAQDWIDVVIPFHIVRTGADIANFYEWVNYSSEQADKDAKGRKADISPVEHLNSKERYMQLIKERNLVPRFAKWSEHPNYMKLVNETRRPYDQSPTLTPSFNLNEAITSWSKFNEKGGYYGGWYNVGEQGYRDAVSRVTEDIQEGRTAKDVDYGRQDVPADAWNTKRQTREQRIHHNAPLINAPEQSVKDIQAAELADVGTKYSLRTDPAPKKTGIGYKVFVLKDGKLYPPMVANLDRGETPVGVWLDADAAPVAGESKTGRPQVKAGGKGTQGGSGVLAYRPGWHLGDIPYALQFNRKNPETGERELFPNNFVWAEVEYAADKDYQKEAESYGYNKNGNYQHSLAGLPRLPKDGAYRYRTNPLPETDPWIITGAMKVNRILKPSEVDAIVREAGREPQPRQADAVTDKQIAELNAELGLGTPTRYSLKREPNTETITDTATATAESLGVKVAIINDATREFKGAFNPKTGEVEINTAFATSEADVQQTVVHEVIGHGGIQAIAGDKFAEWCQQAYDSMSVESRKQTSARHKGITDAKEIGAEYMADLAMGEVINPSLWQRMVGNIRLRLRQLGIDMNLTDADIRYMLYSAHKMADKGKLQDSINHATTLAQLKEKAEQSHDVQEDFLSRPLMQVDPRLAPLSRGKYGMTDVQVMTTKEYTDLLRQTRLAEANDKSLGSRFSTTFIDSTLPIAEFVKSVYELDSINDAYTYDAENNPHIGANTARSKAAYRVAKFGDNHRQGIARNMNEQYQALMKANSDWSYDYVEALRRLYCVAKTGLERNQKVQAREALKEKGKGHPRTDFAGITGAMKWLGIVMTDWKGKKLNSIDWELEAKLLGKRNADQLTTAQVKRILAQKGFPKIEDFVTWYESMVGDTTINDFWWQMSRASHEVLRNQLESGLLSTESYQRLRWGETFFDRLVREGLNPADIEGARYLTHPNELVDRGWITQEVADSFAPYYQYYLPLQGSVDIQQKNVINYDYRESRESKKAVHEIKGHKQMVLDPVYRFFENATKAIHNEEQNRWLRQLLNVVREHEANAKNDALAIATKTYVDANGKPFFRKDANGNYITDADGNYITTPTLAEIKSGQAIEVKRELDVFDNMKTQAELIDQHRVIVYEDGTPISMLFADKSIAQAVYDKPAVFRSKDPLKVGDFEVILAAVGNGINKINRWQSMMFTSKNPMFMIPNIVRDAQGGLQYNLMQGGNQWQLYSQIIFNQKVRQDVWAEIKNRTNGYYSSKSRYGSYVQEFFENGGQTAFTEVASLDAIREDMRRTIKDFEDSAVLRRGETSSQAAMRIAKKGWRVYNEWIERQGMASELMARVATYIAARENNKSIERAIYEAKECSVNFDRKGKGNYRRWYGVVGTFLNAAFQACRREKTLWRTGGATKYLAYRIIKPIVARTLSAGMSYMYYAMDNETSDDEKSFYDWARMYFSQDTHVANANYLFPVLGNDRGSLSIPNAMDDIVWDKAVWLILKRACLGYNAEESVGDDIMEVLSQAVDMTGTNPVSRFVGTFTPAPAFKGEDFTLGDRVIYSAGANPTLAPFVEAYVNADYKGSRLYFEQRDQNDIKPDSSRDLNKYSWGHQIAVALNELSGGTDYDAGWIDLQGSTIQSIFSATGGVYDFVRRSIDMGKEIYHAANDVATTHYGEERVADLADILVAAPIVSRFAKQPISRYEQMAIMDHSRGIDDEVEQWSKQVADAFKEGDSHRAANILNDVVESYRSADYMLALGRQNATSTYYSARSAEIKAYIDNLASQSYYNTDLDLSAQANIIIGRALLWAKCVGNGASSSALEDIKADDSAGLLYSIYKYAIPERRKIIKALATADDANKEQYLNALAKLEQTIVDKFNSVDEVEYLPERKTEEDYNQ